LSPRCGGSLGAFFLARFAVIGHAPGVEPRRAPPLRWRRSRSSSTRSSGGRDVLTTGEPTVSRERASGCA
jgi:hypothetical protein